MPELRRIEHEACALGNRYKGIGRMSPKEIFKMMENEILERFAKEINVRCAETEQRITKTEEFIFISHKTFYILIVLLLTFFSFFIIMIMENTENPEGVYKLVLASLTGDTGLAREYLREHE